MTEYKYNDGQKVSIVENETINEYLASALFTQAIVDPEPYANMGISFSIASHLPSSCKYGLIVQVKTEE
jgi:hypothetical protein